MIRYYGKEPFQAAVIHGGPGAPGSVACMARELSTTCGVIEPIQSRYSVADLIEELHEQIESVSENFMITLIGHSWGAWLAVMFAAKYPQRINKLVLVGSGPFEDRYVPEIMERRLARLSPEDSEQLRRLLFVFEQNAKSKNDDVMKQLALLVEKSDNVDLLPMETDEIDFLPADSKMYAAVWPEAAAMRRDGRLIKALKKLTCPIYVLHGENDPHPVEGFVEPLQKCKVDFTCHVLKNCGHSPFKERRGSLEFYRLLKKILQENTV